MAKKVAANEPGTGDEAQSSIAAPAEGKGRPTPSRREMEARNARPLVGSRDKATKQQARQQANESRNRARIGMMQGDERYLTARDRGPQRRFVRDYVDARWSIGELLIPMMVVVLIMTFIPGFVQVLSLAIIWLFVFFAILDAVLLGFRLKKRLTQKFGADKLQSGFRWYAAMRAFQFRPLRMPKPQVKRGQRPE